MLSTARHKFRDIIMNRVYEQMVEKLQMVK